MSLKENPIILRQSFNKLWTNNIYLPEESEQRLQFISLYKSDLMLQNVLAYKYSKVVTTRIIRGDNDLDMYSNYYKYRKNEKPKKKKFWGRKIVARKKQYKYTLPGRFEKANLYQQLFQEFSDLSLHFLNFLFRLREPIRRLFFFRSGKVMRWMRFNMRSISRQKYFRNTVNQVILLHYYKVAKLFSEHFGRELQKVRKQVHWRLISGFRRLIFTVPTNNKVGRHFYGLLIEVAGRPKGRNRTVVFRIVQGSLASQTYHFRVTMGFGIALAKVGVFGIRSRLAY